MRFLSSRTLLAAGLALTLLTLVTAAQAREVQLAGIRLGDHAVTLLDVYGMPDGIAVGEGEAIALDQTPGGVGGGAQMNAEGIPGITAEPGMPGMTPMEGAGSFPPGGPPPEMGGQPGQQGGVETGAAGRAAGGLITQEVPIWALAIWLTLGPGEVEWVYNKGPVVLGFALDPGGFVKAIAVAAEKCDFARTALWRPHRYIKLGDDFKRVMYRYGYPDEALAFTSSGPGVAPLGGAINVTFGATTRAYSRDVILRYRDSNNIEFTLHNMKVTRIHIWEN